MVSVIIPYYNRGDTLARALDSVCSQTYKDFEIVLVNDGSTDQSAKIVEEYILEHQDIRFKHVTQSNMGPSGARNNGVRHSKGNYLAFLDSDDSWEPLKLEIQLEYMEKNPQIAITGTNYYIVTDHKGLSYSLKPAIIEGNFYRLLFKAFYSTSTIVVRREVFLRDNIWYREGKNQGEDYLLYLHIFRQHRGVRFSRPLASTYKLDYGEGGLTENLNKLWECDLDNLRIVYSENDCSDKKINVALFRLLHIHLFLKHVKRIVKSRWYKTK